MDLADLTVREQTYLMAIRRSGTPGEEAVTTGGLAARVGSSPSTVSEAVRRMVDQALVVHEPYGAIGLTEEGERLAIQLSRRHRILETFLVERLGYPWEEVHDEADALEHVVSPRFVDALDRYLGHPRRDPHGDPIPTADGVETFPPQCRLADLDPGSGGVVCRVSDADPEVLRHLRTLGVELDAEVTVVTRSLSLGTVRVEIAGAAHDLGLPVAAAVWVAQ